MPVTNPGHSFLLFNFGSIVFRGAQLPPPATFAGRSSWNSPHLCGSFPVPGTIAPVRTLIRIRGCRYSVRHLLFSVLTASFPESVMLFDFQEVFVSQRDRLARPGEDENPRAGTRSPCCFGSCRPDRGPVPVRADPDSGRSSPLTAENLHPVSSRCGDFIPSSRGLGITRLAGMKPQGFQLSG